MTTPRDAFRQAVAESAIAAKQTLPQSASRIDSAVALVLSGDTELQDDGTAIVGSRSDAAKKYTVNGTCPCTDFQYAPEHWCSHRLARALQLRAERAVKALPPPLPSPEPSESHEGTTGLLEGKNGVSPSTLPEAPASATVRLTIAGHPDVLFTLRDHDEARLLARLESLLQRFPAPQPPPKAHPASAPQGPEWCAIHSIAMKLNHGKDGSTWFSHKTAEGFCKGR